MSAADFDLGLLVAAVRDRITAISPTVDAFAGEPDARMDSDRRAHAYAAVYASPGNQHHLDLGQAADVLTWQFQVTCAGGDSQRALRAVRAVRAALTDWRPVLPGYSCGVVREEPSFIPPPLAPDGPGTQPPRWRTFLLFTLTLTVPQGGTP